MAKASKKDILKFVHHNWRRMLGYERVVFGYEILVDNVCDPDKTYLDWRPDVKAALKAAGIDVGDEE